MGMNWLDITVIAIFAVFAITGLFRGFVRQVFSILAIGGGLIVATMFFDLAGFMLVQKGFILNSAIANVIGFILVLLFTYLIIQILGWVVTKLIGTLQLSWADRIGGGVLGGLFGVIMSILLIAGLTFFFGEEDPTFKNSVTTPYLKTAYLLIKDSVPDDIDKEFQRARKLIRAKGIVPASKVKEIIVDETKNKVADKSNTDIRQKTDAGKAQATPAEQNEKKDKTNTEEDKIEQW